MLRKPSTRFVAKLFVAGTTADRTLQTAAAADPTRQTAAAADLAYHAVNGALPAGATLPTLASPGRTCPGSAT